jgi:drug/metabolite transporter (DMT)-like permease
MHRGAYLILLATLLLWSGNWIVARAVRDDISPGIATAGRLVIVLLFLAPFVWRDLVARLRALGRRDWAVLGALGFSGGGLHLALQWLGLHYTTATSGMLYLSTSPIFIMLLARPLLDEPIGVMRWLGVATSFIGVVIIATQGHPAALATLTFNIGDLLALSSMAMWSAYTVFLRLRRDSLTTAQFLAVICGFGMLFLGPWVAWEIAHGARALVSPAGALAVAYSAIGSLLLAYAGWSYVVRRLGAARAGVSMHLMPALGILLAALLLQEYPQGFHFVGIALIFAGVALASQRER